MPPFTLGDLVIIEIALVQFFKDVDINMSAGAQVSEIIGKIEIEIGKIKAAHSEQQVPPATPPDPLKPQA